MELLTKTYENKIALMLSCFNLCGLNSPLFGAGMFIRLILTWNTTIFFIAGMTSYLNQKGKRIFDYPRFAVLFKKAIRANAKYINQEYGVEIEYIRKSGVQKESIISKKIKERWDHPCNVHILSAMETCNTFKPWHDNSTGKTFLRPDQSKCFYFINKQLGYVRVSKWCPFRLQVYINGHNLLATELKNAEINYTLVDNAFDRVDGPQKVQELSDLVSIENLYRKLEWFARRFCQIYKDFNLRYHWSVIHAEYATYVVFKKQTDLQQLYGKLVATVIQTVKLENIATFLEQKLDSRCQAEVGNNYNVRIEGSRIKLTMCSISIKMYYNWITSHDMASLKKNNFCLTFLADNLKAFNKPYQEYNSAFDNKEAERKRLHNITSSKTDNHQSYRGFNFFSKDDLVIIFAIFSGGYDISDLINKHLQKLLAFKGSKISRLIKQLRVYELIKKATDSYKYFLTKIEKVTIVLAQKIKELVLVPTYCY